MAFAPKNWESEPNPLGPPTGPAPTPFSGAALIDMEVRLSGYTDSVIAGAVRDVAAFPVELDSTGVADGNLLVYNGAAGKFKVAARLTTAEMPISAGVARSTDGTYGLSAPSGVGLEFIITTTGGAPGLADIQYNGTSL